MSYPNQMHGFDLGYILGLFEGEGFIALNRSLRRNRPQPYFTVHVGIVNTVRELLERVESIVGFGSITSKGDPPPGCKQGWCWRSTRQAENLWLLDLLFPHLIAKKEKAELIMEFLRGRVALRPHTRANVERPYSQHDLTIFERYAKLPSYKPAGKSKREARNAL